MSTREVTQQYRLNQWMEIIRECRSSGHTVSRWCSNHNVRESSCYYWLKRIRVAACESFPVLSTSRQEIVTVNIPSPRPPLESGLLTKRLVGRMVVIFVLAKTKKQPRGAKPRGCFQSCNRLKYCESLSFTYSPTMFTIGEASLSR